MKSWPDGPKAICSGLLSPVASVVGVPPVAPSTFISRPLFQLEM